MNSSQQGARVNGKQINILVAEDNAEAQHLLSSAIKRFFVDKPVAVFATDTLEEAVQLNHIRGPMAVSLIDLELTDSKPENTLRHLYQLGKCVIVMSGVASGATYRDCKRHGARDYIEKPIVIELLIDKIARILDNAEPDKGYLEIQRKAQGQLAQKATNNGGTTQVVVAPIPAGKWTRALVPGLAILIPLLTATLGFVGGGWRTAQAQGAEKQANVDKLVHIETDVKEIKDGNKDRDKNLQTMRIDITKLLVKSGLQPEPSN
jgi:CheY-like chemotaxis protein